MSLRSLADNNHVTAENAAVSPSTANRTGIGAREGVDLVSQ